MILADLSQGMDRLCHRHHDRITEAQCAMCETPICDDCIMRGESDLPFCSLACAERFKVLDQQRQETEKFDPWPTRIWTSIFLVVILTAFGALTGSVMAFAQIRPAIGASGDYYTKFMLVRIAAGASMGAIAAGSFLVRYYRRKD
jgi:hypothetical protein